METLVLMPHIDYESFDETDSNPLEKIQVFAVSTPEARRRALIIALRQVIDPYQLINVARKPAVPQIAVTEVGTDRVTKLLKRYEADLAKYAAAQAESDIAQQFFEQGIDDAATDEHLEAWMQHSIEDSRSNGEPPRFYFRTVIA